MYSEIKSFGKTAAGEPVRAFTMKNEQGMSLTALDYGCTIQSLCVPDKNGHPVDVVLGYDNLESYEKNGGYLGAAIGRVGNRIAAGRFTLNQKEYALALNDGPNHLHGGVRGFDKYIWQAELANNTLVFTRVSPDGEEGYPGTLHVRISYRLTPDNALEITYDAQSDADTLVNLTNHTYFNLCGGGSVLDHELQVYSELFCENDAHCLPTGILCPVADTPFDFRQPKKIGQDIGCSHVQLLNAGGYDHNYVLSDTAELHPAATLSCEETGIVMHAETTLPGMQVYSGNFLTDRVGKGGRLFGRRYALCLETQVHPDAIHHDNFPSPVLRAGEKYHTQTIYRFEAR